MSADTMNVKTRNRWAVSLLLVCAVLTCSLVALVVTVPLTAKAATLYVGGTGFGNYTTIQEAIDASSPGDTIFVYNGTYNEQVKVNKTLTLVGENRTTTIIDGGASGYVVNVTADWVNITGFQIINASSGESSGAIELYKVSHCNITGNNISMNQANGILVRDSNDNIVAFNEMYDINWYSMRFVGSNNNIIMNNTMINDSGSVIEWSYNNTVENNTYRGFQGYGAITFLHSEGGVVKDNLILDGAHCGVCTEYSTNITVFNNTIDRGYGGVYVQYSTNISVSFNSIYNTEFSMYIFFSSKCTINNNVVLESGEDGIYLDMSYDNDVLWNFVMNSAIRWGHGGIVLQVTENTNVSFNTVRGNEIGIVLSNSDSNNVTNNLVNINNWGISLNFAHNNVLTDNRITPYQDSGVSIWVESSEGGFFARNTMVDNGFFFWGNQPQYWDSHTIETSNEINGRPVQYWKKTNGGTIPSGASQVLIGNCSNVTIENQSIDRVNTGIEIGFSSNLTIFNNTIFNNFIAFIDVYSKNNTFIGNNLTNNSYGGDARNSEGCAFSNNTVSNIVQYGFRLYQSKSAIISGNVMFNITNDASIRLMYSTDNRVEDNTVYSGLAGVTLSPADRNLILRNNFTNNWYGISIGSSKQNIIVENRIEDNYYGLTFQSTQLSVIYHNSFINNTFQTSGSGGATYWDNGYPSGGNYWSDYSGIDNMSGPNQDMPGGDGFGDTPRQISGTSSFDRYPLMGPFTAGPRSPSAPLNPSATADSQQVDFTWDPPLLDGGSPITNYTIYRGFSSGSETYLTTIGNLTTHTDGGLVNGQTYYYRVAAVNVVGEGLKSVSVSGTPATVPGPPTGVVAMSSFSRVMVQWQVPADNGGSPITNYSIYRGTTSGGESHLVTVGNVLTYTDLNVVNGQRYYYVVTAINAIGEGNFSLEVSAVPVDRPSQPLNLVAVGSDGEVVLTWDPPATDNGTPVTNYYVYRSVSPGPEVLLDTLGNVLTYTDTAVTNGQLYIYRVSAKNMAGEGSKSDYANAIPVGLPGPPLGLAAVAGDGQVVLTWNTPTSDGGAPITNYIVYRGTAPGAVSPIVTLGVVLNYTDTGLANGQTYYYQIAAVNVKGAGQRSNEASATPMSAPSPPRNLVAVAGVGQVTLTWAVPLDNGGSAITSYIVYRGTVQGNTSFLISLGNVLTYTDTNVTIGVTYYYEVSALNSFGESPRSNEASATPAAQPTKPSAPQNLQAVGGNGRVTLTWSPPSSDGGSPITNYRVYEETSPGNEVFIAEVGIVFTHTVFGLTNGQTYHFTVRAWNALGESVSSNRASATPATLPGRPTGLVASAGDEQISLTWSPPTDDGGSPVTGYNVYRGTSSGGETFLVSVGDVLTYVDTGLTDGQRYYYKVSATNAVGEGALSSEASAVSGYPSGNVWPKCAIESPSDGSTVSGTVNLIGNASDQDGVVVRVEVRIGDGSWFTVTGRNWWSYSWDTTGWPDGQYTIGARSFDGTNYSSVATVTVTVDNAGAGPTDGDVQDEGWFWGLVLLAIIGLVLVAYMFLERRKRSLEDEEAEEPEEPEEE